MSASELPNGWCSTSLGILKWGSGGTPRSGVAEYYNGDIPWLVIGDLRDGVVSDSQSKITPAGLANSSAKWVEPGSVLIAMYGASIGKLGIAGRRLTTNQAIAFTKPPPGIEASYLFWYLAARQKDLVRLGKGGAQQNISQTVLKSFPFLLAPTNEQSRIVAEIERQLTRLDAGVSAIKRVQAQLKRSRASVLKAACEGRLVPTEAELARREKRDYEPADKLLARILKERRARWEADHLAKMKAAGKPPTDDKWKAKYVEPVAPETSGLPSLQSGWTWSTIDQLSSVVTKGSSPNWQGFDYCASGVLFIRSQNIGWGLLQLDERVFLPRAFNEKESKSVLANGDVLLNIVGASIGRAALATAELAGANINQAVALIRPVVPSLGAYVLRYLLSPLAQQYIHREKVDVARANLSLADVSEMPVPLPPLSEQQRIIFEVESRLSVSDAVELALMSNEMRATRLRQAVLKTAFDGSLVPQDPRDEPASKLLERISAATENKPLPKQSRAKQTTAVLKTKATR
jgi:type I restriction enzyme S subunit